MEESPYGIQSKKLVIWLFIVADAATFGALLFGYGYVRVGSPNWTRPFEFTPTILNAMIMTAILLTSSLTMLAAVEAAKAGRREVRVRWLGATAGLGIGCAALEPRGWVARCADAGGPPGQRSGR